ncbi:MAG: CvpA family protein [Acidimicrobiia bacterium]
MIDVLVGTLVVVLIVRGWMKGLLREAIEVGTLVVGAVVAFRLAPFAGRMFASLFGMSPDFARVLGGVLLFVAIWVAASIAAVVITRSLKVLPGLTTLNRIGGAALGIVYTAVLAVIALTLLSAAPLPAAVADEIDRSALATYVAEPVGPAQQVVGAVSGDRALQSMAWIRRAVDDWVVDPAVTRITLPALADNAGIHASASAAEDLLNTINKKRIDDGLGPLAWSEPMSLVAATRALSAYQTGNLVSSSSIEERLGSAGVHVENAEERLVLAATGESVADVTHISDTPSAIGVGVVEGPYGLIAVLVTAG